MASEPKHLVLARKDLGLKEVVGKKHNPKILAYFKDVGHGRIVDDETAWCAAFVGAKLEKAGLRSTKSLLARSYLKWGKRTTNPKPGDIVVLKRGKSTWQGHVGFYLADLGDRIQILGGNQKNAVNVASFPKKDLLGYRTPDTLKTSGVVRGTTTATAGGVIIAAEPAAEIVTQLQEADGYISAGTWFSFLIGAMIVASALYALYHRWNAGGRPLPEFLQFLNRDEDEAPKTRSRKKNGLSLRQRLGNWIKGE